MSAISENNTVNPLSLTEGAVKQLRSIVAEQNIPAQYGLRIGVKGGGCSGFSYVLGFDEPKEGDDILTINGMRVLMQKSHAIYLLGMEIDFLEGLNNRGFSFSNPNAKETCGCGTSFAA
ncbi:MAG: iron-sulfur cluster assembly accessory protein [Saprospiraceae bacterium]|nr:iron-sulfur cluster assembly accessory protein [Saprospiraceae bacterium]